MKISTRPVGDSSSAMTARGAIRRPRSSPGAQGGFAVLVVLLLLVIMVSLAIGNSVVLAQLQKEIKLVEHRQQHRHATINSTNAPAGPALRTAAANAGAAAPVSTDAP